METVPPQAKIKIGITDDHLLFRRGLRSLLSDFKDMEVCVEADNGVDLFNKLKEVRQYPDVLLLDVEMPEMDGLEVLRTINRKHYPINVLILTTHNEEALIIELVRLGAKGFLLKNADISEVVKAIQSIAEGQMYFNDKVSTTIIKSVGRMFKAADEYKRTPYFADLNAREKDVMRLTCSEKSTKEIAAIMSLSERTVEWHRSNIFEKTGTRNIAGLVLFAIRHGIAE